MVHFFFSPLYHLLFSYICFTNYGLISHFPYYPRGFKSHFHVLVCDAFISEHSRFLYASKYPYKDSTWVYPLIFFYFRCGFIPQLFRSNPYFFSSFFFTENSMWSIGSIFPYSLTNNGLEFWETVGARLETLYRHSQNTCGVQGDMRYRLFLKGPNGQGS